MPTASSLPCRKSWPLSARRSRRLSRPGPRVWAPFACRAARRLPVCATEKMETRRMVVAGLSSCPVRNGRSPDSRNGRGLGRPVLSSRSSDDAFRRRGMRRAAGRLVLGTGHRRYVASGSKTVPARRPAFGTIFDGQGVMTRAFGFRRTLSFFVPGGVRAINLSIFARNEPRYVEKTGRTDGRVRFGYHRVPLPQLPAFSLSDPRDGTGGVRRGDGHVRLDPVRTRRADDGARNRLFPFRRQGRKCGGEAEGLFFGMGGRAACRSALFCGGAVVHAVGRLGDGLCRPSVLCRGRGGHRPARCRNGRSVRATAAGGARVALRVAAPAFGRGQSGVDVLFLYGAPLARRPRIRRGTL